MYEVITWLVLIGASASLGPGRWFLAEQLFFVAFGILSAMGVQRHSKNSYRGKQN
jgi:hypothetical protein